MLITNKTAGYALCWLKRAFLLLFRYYYLGKDLTNLIKFQANCLKLSNWT